MLSLRALRHVPSAPTPYLWKRSTDTCTTFSLAVLGDSGPGIQTHKPSRLSCHSILSLIARMLTAAVTVLSTRAALCCSIVLSRLSTFTIFGVGARSWLLFYSVQFILSSTSIYIAFNSLLAFRICVGLSFHVQLSLITSTHFASLMFSISGEHF